MEAKTLNQSIISSQFIDSNPKSRTLFLVLGAIVFVEIVVAVIFLPGLFSSISTNQVEITELSAQVNDLTAQAQILETIDMQQVNKDLKVASLALPTEKKVSGIVSSLTALASSSGIVVSQLELTPCKISTRSGALKILTPKTTDCQNVQLEKGVNGIHLSMDVQADKNQLQGFVEKLYHVSPMLGVSEFGYISNTKGEMSSMAILLYFQPVGANSPKKVTSFSSNEEDVMKSLGQQVVILP